jgi:hypothetical protein
MFEGQAFALAQIGMKNTYSMYLLGAGLAIVGRAKIKRAVPTLERPPAATK